MYEHIYIYIYVLDEINIFIEKIKKGVYCAYYLRESYTNFDNVISLKKELIPILDKNIFDNFIFKQSDVVFKKHYNPYK